MDDDLSLITNGMVELDPADDKTMQRRNPQFVREILGA